jgi:hypothetical protein
MTFDPAELEGWPLELAAKYQSASTFASLWNHRSPVSAELARDCFYTSIESGNIEVVRYLVETRAVSTSDIRRTSLSHLTLELAYKACGEKVMRFLIDNGLDIASPISEASPETLMDQAKQNGDRHPLFIQRLQDAMCC